MHFFCIRLIAITLLCSMWFSSLARTGRYRCMWRDNPSTTMVIGWDQRSGSNPKVFYGTKNCGKNLSAYQGSAIPSRTTDAKGMRNNFVRLSGLKANTVYYFVIKDSESLSKTFSFQTAPDSEDDRLSIIAGGDSRNHRTARLDANRLVAKLRPHVVLFSGDMTDGDSPAEWQEWFDDWQETFGSDGRIFPIVATRGNHEASNKGLVDLFDVKNPDLYYAFNLGGDLLRVYTLNTLIPSGGAQKSWLQRDLQASGDKIWKFAQYHQAMRPHTDSKPEKNELILNWATLFHKYKVNVAVESDAHVVKWTYPIRPSRQPGSEEGFIRDDENGTVYIGEGCWGAPLRDINDRKAWTRASGSFNQFKWIFVDKYKVEIRTIKTDGSNSVASVNPNNRFIPPRGLVVWTPRTGDVIRIKNKNLSGEAPPEPDYEEEIVQEELAPPMEILNFSAKRRGGTVKLSWTCKGELAAVRFEIQRSLDGGNNFKSIQQLSGKGMGSNDYEYFDRTLTPSIPTRRINYRLRYQQPSGKEYYFNPPGVDEAPPINPANTAKPEADRPPPKRPDDNKASWSDFPKLIMDPSTGRVKFKYQLARSSNVVISLINSKFQEASRASFSNQSPKTYLKSFDLNALPRGRYLIVIKADGKVIKRFRVEKT